MNFGPVLVTGVSTGIGHDIVRVLIQNQIPTLGTVREQNQAEKLKTEFGPLFTPIVLDVNDHAAVDQLPQTLQKLKVHKLKGLVNNAGIALAAPYVDQPFSEVELIMQTNVLSVMKLTQVLTPLLETPVGEMSSTIVNISSISGKSAAPFLSIYAASKHAIEGFSEGLRKEYRPLGIDVVVVGPGSIKTPIWQKGFVQIKEKYKSSRFAESFSLFMQVAMNEQQNALEVSEISLLVLKIIQKKSTCFRYAPIPRKWMNWYIPKFIPKRVYDRLTAKALKLERVTK